MKVAILEFLTLWAAAVGSGLHQYVQTSDGVAMIQKSTEASRRFSDNEGQEYGKEGQSVHWIFTTDCSAYMFNQGNLLLASAHHVGQPGNFTWIMSGCDRDEQKKETLKLAHPRAKVFHVGNLDIKDNTGKVYRAFQASNRPTSIAAWFQQAEPQEDAIGILDPDEMFMRPVHLLKRPGEAKTGPWETHAVAPKIGSGAYYGIGCTLVRWSKQQLAQICSHDSALCEKAKGQHNDCVKSYSSGPPWVMHKKDAGEVFATWPGAAATIHDLWHDIFSEQAAYGVAQVQFDVKANLDPFWFLSSSDDPPQDALWQSIAKAGPYDPCSERAPPSPELNFPPLWHACLTYEIPHLKGQGFRLHKDHILKDLLDCDAPLLHHPPTDALKMYQVSDKQNYRQTWAVCTYTNLVNFYATAYKQQYCKEPNLAATFSYPDHSQDFLNPNSHLKNVFRRGGWQDVDYKVA